MISAKWVDGSIFIELLNLIGFHSSLLFVRASRASLPWQSTFYKTVRYRFYKTVQFHGASKAFDINEVVISNYIQMCWMLHGCLQLILGECGVFHCITAIKTHFRTFVSWIRRMQFPTLPKTELNQQLTPLSVWTLFIMLIGMVFDFTSHLCAFACQTCAEYQELMPPWNQNNVVTQISVIITISTINSEYLMMIMVAHHNNHMRFFGFFVSWYSWCEAHRQLQAINNREKERVSVRQWAKEWMCSYQEADWDNRAYAIWNQC